MEHLKEWHEQRKQGLGGSDSPVILGVSPFKTPTELWYEKKGYSEEAELTPAMKRGTVLEPIVADMYALATGRGLKVEPNILQHPDYPWMQANIDRLVKDGTDIGVLEIKCPGLQVFSKCKREGVPDYYQTQLQHYLAVTGKKWGSLAVFNAERWELIFFDVSRDDELINMIIVKDAEFWQLVQDGKPPGEITETIELPPIGATDMVKIETDQWRYAVDRFREAKQLREEAEALEGESKATLQQIMDSEGAEVAEGYNFRAYYRLQAGRKSIDSKMLKIDMPDVWQKYQKQGKGFKTFKSYFLTKGGYNE